MVQIHHLAKSISDAGWYQVQTFTAYKAEDVGKLVEFCIANGTSRECHVYGNVLPMTLADRVFRCSECGNIEDRDVNASINILNRSTVGITGRACQGCLDRELMQQEASLPVGR